MTFDRQKILESKRALWRDLAAGMKDVSAWVGTVGSAGRQTLAPKAARLRNLQLSPFNQRGGLGKAHQLFGEQLPKLLDELNEVLAA